MGFWTLAAMMILASPALGQVGAGQGQPDAPATQLAMLSFEGPHSATVRAAKLFSYDLSGGAPVDLAKWYSPEFPNLSAIFVTKLARDFTLVWGGAMGEAGPKYRIGPTVNLGFSYRVALSDAQALQVDLFSGYGAALTERSCIGDYGELGGVQRVNCRLAASDLPPRETLSHIWNRPPSFYGSLRVMYSWVF